MFIAVTHHFYVDHDLIAILCRKLFEDALLGELNTTLQKIGDDLTIPLAENYNMFYVWGELVVTYPIIFIENLAGFWAESDSYKRKMCFLFYFCSIFEPLEQDWLEHYFIGEYIL